MNNCVTFLQWALPLMEMRWQGFRKVRRQVCRKIQTRIGELRLNGFPEYRKFLMEHPEEWKILDSMARISISRFFRDLKTWDILKRSVIPELAGKAMDENRPLRCWSAGCASGEEPYSLAILWKFQFEREFRGLPIQIIATDADKHMLARAEDAVYSGGSLRDLPGEWASASFLKQDGKFKLDDTIKEMVDFSNEDIRHEMPDGVFDLVFCKNLVAMYFSESLAVRVFAEMAKRIRPGGYLILGNHENFPLERVPVFIELIKETNIYQRIKE